MIASIGTGADGLQQIAQARGLIQQMKGGALGIPLDPLILNEAVQMLDDKELDIASQLDKVIQG